MIQVNFRTTIGFVGLRIAVHGADDLPDALHAQEGFTIRPLPDYLRDDVTGAEPDYSRYRSLRSPHPRTWSTTTAWGRR